MTLPIGGLPGWGVLCGLGIGLGLWSIVAAVPKLNRPSLADRVAPYLVDLCAEAREFTERHTVHPLPVIGALFAPAAASIKRSFAIVVGGSRATELRLRQSGSRMNVEQFRSGQLMATLIGLAVGLPLAVLAAQLHSVAVAGQIALPPAAAACGFVLWEWRLRRAATARLARVTSEFSTVVEFMTLSLSAGEGILDALRRLARVSSGELSREFGAVVADVNSGIPLAQALQELAGSIRLPVLTRCIDAITGALERGTPLAEVLRAQSQDARDESKRSLLETAGKKEVAMLVPLVFLILPTTVLFAIFPGIFVLRSGF